MRRDTEFEGHVADQRVAVFLRVAVQVIPVIQNVFARGIVFHIPQTPENKGGSWAQEPGMRRGRLINMLNLAKEQEIREVVGVFDNQEKLDAAVAELEVTAFPRPDISVLDPGKNGPFTQADGLADNPNARRGISVRPEEKTIGSVVLIGCCAYIFGCGAAILIHAETGAALLAAITGGSLLGATIGAVALLAISSRIRTRRERQIRKGGLLLWVRTPDPRKEKIAQDILRKHGGRNVHIHSIT